MYNSKKYNVKKYVRSFRDLEIYQKTLDVSVIIMKDLVPAFGQEKTDKKSAPKGKSGGRVRVAYPFVESLANGALQIPLWISEAHSVRFGNHETALGLLEKAMAGCNKMTVYLEQIKGIYGSETDGDLIDDLVRRYSDVRTKIFRLEKSWQKWYEPSRPI